MVNIIMNKQKVLYALKHFPSIIENSFKDSDRKSIEQNRFLLNVLLQQINDFIIVLFAFRSKLEGFNGNEFLMEL